MANKHRGEAVIELDRSRTLKLTFNAMCEAESLLGRPVISGQIGMSEIRALLWAGLKWEDKTLTPERMGNLLQKHAHLTKIIEVLSVALGDFFGDMGEVEGAGSDSNGESSDDSPSVPST